MPKCAVKICCGLVTVLLTVRVISGGAAESYFGTMVPPTPETAEPTVAMPVPATAKVPVPSAAVAFPTPVLASAVPLQAVRLPEEIKLDAALGTPAGFDEALEERFRQTLGRPQASAGHPPGSYRKNLDQVRSLLLERKTIEAWQKLQETAERYDACDAHANRELATWIKSALDLNHALTQVDAKAEQTRSAELHAAAGLAALLRNPGTAAPGKSLVAPLSPPRQADWVVSTNQAELERKLELKLKELEAAEARRETDRSKEKIVGSLSQADQDFTAFVVQLCAEGKFEQAMLAQPFYEQAFQANCVPAAAAVIAEAEAKNRQVDALIQLALDKWRARRIAAATENLRQAFANSACHVGLIDLDDRAREDIKAFVEAAEGVRRDVKRRRFGAMTGQIEAIRKCAPDFDPAKVLALVHACQLESGFHLDAANQAWQAKRLEAAREGWWLASKTWSDNPALDNFPEVVRSTWDVGRRAAEFDQLAAAGSCRQIADQRQLFTDQLTGDAERLERLRKIVESVVLVDLALTKIENTRRAGDVDGAWELAEAAALQWPDNAELQTWLTKLSKECADYVLVIRRAREAEGKGQFGYSLNWYAAALQIYPGSQRAREASTRLRDQVFPAGERQKFVLAAAQGAP